MELYHRNPGAELLEFTIELHESAETDVWKATVRNPVRAGDTVHYVETVKNPDPRDLIDKILSAHYGELED